MPKFFNVFALLFLITFSLKLVGAEDVSPDSNISAIQLSSPGETKLPAEISNMEISAEIHGGFARTEVELSFYNPNTDDISIDFQFPLPQNSTLDNYALDINGVMVDGVIVDKNKGRIVFEKITRSKIDPGLVEKVAGNLFKTRIFPVQAKNSRTIKLSYFTELKAYNNKSLYTLPLFADSKINKLAIDITTFDDDSKPVITSDNTLGLRFSEWRKGYSLKFADRNIFLKNRLTLEIPSLNRATTLVSDSVNDFNYFLLKTPVLNTAKASIPSYKNIDLVWDASHSRSNADHELEIKALEKAFNIFSVQKVNLFILRNSLNRIEQFSLPKQKTKLINTLKSLHYDGGTDLSQLAKLKKNDSKAIFVFTDGQDTFGEYAIPALPNKTYVFSTNQASNPEYNKRLAQNAGGDYFYISNAQELDSVFKAITHVRPSITSINVLSGKVSKLPTTPLLVEPNGQLITGKLHSAKATIELNYSIDGTSKSTNYQISKSSSRDHNLANQFWARQQLQQLSINKQANKDAIMALSKNFNLVTDFTSLIVLENLEQYIDHSIAPPESLPDMRKQYFAQTSKTKPPEDKGEHLDKVYQQWQQRVSWWNTKYPIQVTTRLEEQSTITQLNRETINNQPSDSFRDYESEENRIVTTGSRLSAADLQAEKVASGSRVDIPEWQSNAAYLTKLTNTSKNNQLNTYYSLKQEHANSPAFYFDVAAFFFNQGNKEIGLQVLSNIAELKLKDSRMLRTMAMRLKQYGFSSLAIDSYKTVLLLRPEEPQSYRDLALVLAGNNTLEDNQEAIKLLNQVIEKPWDRFEGIQVTAISELNHLINSIDKKKYDLSFIDERFLQHLPIQLRIVSSWDTDLTDIDLWVIEPSGEKVTYDRSLSKAGGKFHQDYTQGYGPEEYLLKEAPKGSYTIKVHYYGNDSPEISGATTLFLDVYLNYGAPNQEHKVITLRLDKQDQEYLVGEITI